MKSMELMVGKPLNLMYGISVVSAAFLCVVYVVISVVVVSVAVSGFHCCVAFNASGDDTYKYYG